VVQSLNETLDDSVADLEDSLSDREASSTVLLSENSRCTLPPWLAG
jgi:hypothetical protein